MTVNVPSAFEAEGVPRDRIVARSVHAHADGNRRHHTSGLIVGNCHHAASAPAEKAIMRLANRQ
jgi:hypothetical protein